MQALALVVQTIRGVITMNENNSSAPIPDQPLNQPSYEAPQAVGQAQTPPAVSQVGANPGYQAPPQPSPGAPEQPGFAFAPQPQAQPVKPYTGIGSVEKDKWVAAVLAFVLGWLGIHKFYLGYKNEGLAMLLVGTIGSLCFGLGTLVMAVIGIIEAVRYVILTQEDFQNTYVKNRKGWF
jgi:TM2 domain-containing membrane protein YozV